MENENIINVYLDNDITETSSDLTYTENTINDTNNIVEVLSENTTNSITLDIIHNDLGVICTFLVVFSVLIFIRIIYKFFSMFF